MRQVAAPCITRFMQYYHVDLASYMSSVTRKMTKRFFTFNCRLLVHCSADAHLQNDWRCA